MIAYYGPYNGRRGGSPFLGQPYAPAAPPPVPAVPTAAAAVPAPAPAAVRQEEGPPVLEIGGAKVSIWTVALAGSVIVAAIAVGAASMPAARRGARS